MAYLLQLFAILQFFFIIMCCMAQQPGSKPYIVYMGSPSDQASVGGDDLSHLQIFSSLASSIGSERRSLLRSYSHAFRGFSAMLTDNEASVLSGHDGVVFVFTVPVLQLHTTRSWDFLEATDSKFRA